MRWWGIVGFGRRWRGPGELPRRGLLPVGGITRRFGHSSSSRWSCATAGLVLWPSAAVKEDREARAPSFRSAGAMRPAAWPRGGLARRHRALLADPSGHVPAGAGGG